MTLLWSVIEEFRVCRVKRMTYRLPTPALAISYDLTSNHITGGRGLTVPFGKMVLLLNGTTVDINVSLFNGNRSIKTGQGDGDSSPLPLRPALKIGIRILERDILSPYLPRDPLPDAAAHHRTGRRTLRTRGDSLRIADRLDLSLQSREAFTELLRKVIPLMALPLWTMLQRAEGHRGHAVHSWQDPWQGQGVRASSGPMGDVADCSKALPQERYPCRIYSGNWHGGGNCFRSSWIILRESG